MIEHEESCMKVVYDAGPWRIVSDGKKNILERGSKPTIKELWKLVGKYDEVDWYAGYMDGVAGIVAQSRFYPLKEGYCSGCLFDKKKLMVQNGQFVVVEHYDAELAEDHSFIGEEKSISDVLYRRIQSGEKVIYNEP